MELQFFAGMAVFALGHLLLIGWFVGQKRYTPVSLLVWVILMVLMLRIFRKELSGGKERPALYLMILYPAVLMAMASWRWRCLLPEECSIPGWRWERCCLPYRICLGERIF